LKISLVQLQGYFVAGSASGGDGGGKSATVIDAAAIIEAIFSNAFFTVILFNC
jgi:hypothetical protein